MDDLIDFLTTLHAEKPTAAQPKQQKQSDDNPQAQRPVVIKQATSEWDKTERRSNPDRRRKKVNRGRWVDSRQKKDRRQSNDFYTTI